MDVTVIGGGYVGTATATWLASQGHDVILLEASAARRRQLSTGSLPIHEPGLDELFAKVLRDGNLRVEGNARAALGGRQILMVCVGTPLEPDGEADLSQVRTACQEVAQYGGADTPVVVRSTLPLGTSAQLADWLKRPDFAGVVTNPEFLREGNALADFAAPARIVIGTRDGSPSPASDRLRELHVGISAPVIVTDFASAEMIKNAANGYLAVRLSYINEIADLCEAYGADIEQVVHGLGLDPRIGPAYLRPGIGFGGSCIPKELTNLVRLGSRHDLALQMFDAAARSNDRRPMRVADRLERTIGPFAGTTVALLGLAFKAGTDDTRYSPAIALARELVSRGAKVQAHDPRARPDAVRGIDGLTRVPTVEDAIADADLVILATDWPEYRDEDWAALAGRVRRATVFDGRNLLDRSTLVKAGWRVIRVGQADSATAARHEERSGPTEPRQPRR